MKIERVDEFKFMLDGVPYNTGTIVPKYAGIVRSEGVITQAKIGFAYADTGEEIQKQYKKWQDFTDAADADFDTFEECALYIADALAAGDGVSSVLSDAGAVTQLTSITTGVTLNNRNGIVTTVSSTLAADAQAVFTVTNSKVVAGSNVVVSVTYPSGSTGAPVARVGAVSAGSFTVVLANAGTAVLNAAVKINFVVL